MWIYRNKDSIKTFLKHFSSKSINKLFFGPRSICLLILRKRLYWGKNTCNNEPRGRVRMFSNTSTIYLFHLRAGGYTIATGLSRMETTAISWVYQILDYYKTYLGEYGIYNVYYMFIINIAEFYAKFKQRNINLFHNSLI